MIIYDETAFFCHFVAFDQYFECSKCGNKIQILDSLEDPPLVPCASPLLKDAGSDNIKEFMEPILGQNLADDSSIHYRHSICRSCEHFINNSCKECGCVITKDRNYMNKLASKDSSCPVGKW